MFGKHNIGFFFAGIVFIILGSCSAMKSYSMRSAIKTKAFVLKNSMVGRGQRDIVYKFFDIDGKAYKGMDRVGSRSKLRDAKKGERIDVYYLPSNPKKSMITINRSVSDALAAVFSGFGLLVASLWNFLPFNKKKNKIQKEAPTSYC